MRVSVSGTGTVYLRCCGKNWNCGLQGGWEGQWSSAPGGPAGFRERIKARGAVAGRTHKSERKSSARNVTAENYSCVGSLCETEVINGPLKREAERTKTNS
jgi:hypothetical protein